MKEDTIRNTTLESVQRLGLFQFLDMSSWSYTKLYSVIGDDYLTTNMKIKFIGDVILEFTPFGIDEVMYAKPIYYKLKNDEELGEITYFGRFWCIIDVYGGPDFEDFVGDIQKHYVTLPDNIIDEIFDITVMYYEQKK